MEMQPVPDSDRGLASERVSSNLLQVLIRAGLLLALVVLSLQILSPFITLMVWAVILDFVTLTAAAHTISLLYHRVILGAWWFDGSHTEFAISLSALFVMMKAAKVDEAVYKRNAIIATIATLYSTYAIYASGGDAVLGGMIVLALAYILYGFLAPRFAKPAAHAA